MIDAQLEENVLYSVREFLLQPSLRKMRNPFDKTSFDLLPKDEKSFALLSNCFLYFPNLLPNIRKVIN